MTSTGESAPEKRVVTWEESRAATVLIAEQASVLELLPLDELLELYRNADNLGAIFDPTGYRKHGRELEPAARMVRAAKELIAASKAAAAVVREGGGA